MNNMVILQLKCICYFQENLCETKSLQELTRNLKVSLSELEQSINPLVQISILEQENIDGILNYRYLRPKDLDLTISLSGREGDKTMDQFQLEELLQEIEIHKKQLLETAFKSKSLVHHNVLRKSQELDKLIVKYQRLLKQNLLGISIN